MNLQKRLEAIQESLGLKDEPFARKLGVSKTLWILIKQGKRPIRFDVISGALAAFPESDALKEDAYKFLVDTANEQAEQTQAVA